jgi:hypothetical protein
MAKATINFKSIDLPAAVQSPLYAGVGASDLAVTAVKEYVADVQKKITEFDASKVRANALKQAKARRAAVESRVAELQGEALSIPTKVQKVVDDNVETVTSTYSELAKRGEAVVRGTKLPSTATVEVKVNTTNPTAKKATRKPAVAKVTPVKKAAAAKPGAAKKAAAKKAPAKKAATTKAPTQKSVPVKPSTPAASNN